MRRQRTDITAGVIERCKSLGFVLAGVASAEPTKREPELRAWLAAGKHGEMAYLARNLEALLDPRKVLDGVKSIICVADRYHAGTPDDELEPGAGRIARYARGEDYHKVIKRRLHALCDSLRRDHPGERFRACVDTAPVLEREYAQRAGLGAVGKHTLLIAPGPGMGSYLLLGEVLTTLELTPSEPATKDPCGTCTRCIDACPTDAITPWSVDATKCISYLTIEHRSGIGREFHGPIGEWIFGCDICQEVCPHNQPTQRSLAGPLHTAYSPQRDAFELDEVLTWDEDDRRAVFTRSALKRARLNMMKRNALIAAGNALRTRAASNEGHTALLERLRAIAHDDSEDDMVREMAVGVLADLGA